MQGDTDPSGIDVALPVEQGPYPELLLPFLISFSLNIL